MKICEDYKIEINKMLPENTFLVARHFEVQLFHLCIINDIFNKRPYMAIKKKKILE